MRLKILMVAAVAFTLALAACSTETPTPEVIVVTATSPGADTLPTKMLGVEWQLHSVLESEPAAQSVIPQPPNYTIQFAADGTAAIRADCNNVGANYTVSGSNLTITLGPATLAFCGEDSGDNLYMTALGAVTSYAMSEYGMALDVADAARLQYIEANDFIDLPEEPGGVDIIADVNVQVRTGPGTQFRISYWASAGDQGEVIGQSPDDLYWVVPFPEDNPYYEQGWVLKSVSSISNPDNLEIPVITPPLLNPTIYVTPPEAGQPQGKVFQTAEVMTGPGNAYQIWGLTSIGADVVITGQSGSFWRIQLPTSYSPTGDGWIDGRYLQASNTDGVPAANAPTLDVEARPTASGGSQAALRITAERGAVRTGPGSSYDKIMDVEFGTTMGIIGVSADNKFWVVNLPTQTAAVGYGWINVDSNTCSKCDIPSAYTPVYRTP
ncbi:MAG: META domain-containing protein [Anaerolineales bacterium]